MRLSKISKPMDAPGLSEPVWFSVPLEATALVLSRVRTRRSVTNTPSVLQISTFCTWSV